MLRILAAEKYKGMTRLSFIAGRRVLWDSRRLRSEAEIVSRSLKVPVYETASGALSLLEKAKELEKKLDAYEGAVARREAEALIGGALNSAQGGLIRRTYAFDMDMTLRIGKAAQKLSEALIVLASEKDCTFAAFCSQKSRDLRSLFQEKLAAQGGSGGGGGGFFQGAFSSAGALKNFVDSLDLLET
jgi:alanyl-tRNA synthetase